jgi:hypothetical protein
MDMVGLEERRTEAWEVRLCDPCALCARVSRVCPVCVSAPPGVFLPARTAPAPPKNPLVYRYP